MYSSANSKETPVAMLLPGALRGLRTCEKWVDVRYIRAYARNFISMSQKRKAESLGGVKRYELDDAS